METARCLRSSGLLALGLAQTATMGAGAGERQNVTKRHMAFLIEKFVSTSVLASTKKSPKEPTPMKTVTSVFTAALSFAALASTASAMPHITTFDGLSAPTITAKLNPATSGAGFARAAAGNAKGTHAPDTTPPIFGGFDTTPPTFGVSDTSPPTFGISDRMPQVQTTFKLVSQSADIAVEKAMNSGSSDENIAAAACTTPVNNALIAVVIIAAVDADNCPKPQAATAIEYGLIAALIGGGPDATDTTTTGETETESE